jgi:hypothetical protein
VNACYFGIGRCRVSIWCITVVNAADLLGVGATTLPKNYTTVVIDPYTGSLKTFRPTL